MKIVKHDGYNDIFNGGADGSPKPFFMSDASYHVGSFYNDNATAKRIVDVIPEEMVTAGFKMSGVKDEKEFKSLWDSYKLDSSLVDLLCWARLYGGAAMVAIINDNRMLTSQAKPGAKLEGVRVYDRFAITIEKRVTNARSPRYGEPEIYKVSPGDNMQPYLIHHSRVFIADGERVTQQARKQNQGWGASVLNKSLIDAICDYDYCESLATQILRRKQQAVWKVKGLAEMCDDDDAQYAARLRLAQVDDNSGVGRAIGIDAETEEYDVLNSDISGVPEFLSSKMDRIVSLSGIHEIIIKNKNVGGVSASQNTALETFYKLVDRKREEDYRPLLEFLLPFIVDEEEWSIEFEPLSVPSKKEESEITKNNVESVTKAITEQIIDLEEARDTLRSIAPEFKLKDGNNINIREPKEITEPEPGLGEKLEDEN
ncbi:portal protein [Escherichia phage vB_EcoS_SA32RD]|nr:portal protein [Escherichia phage vB_EcoS_SA32RD]